LDAHSVEYVDDRAPGSQRIYKFIVTYSCHCFAKTIDGDPGPEFVYSAPKEERHFDFERYELSKGLRNIIESLPSRHVVHAGHENYAVVEMRDDDGFTQDYFIVFSAFREMKKLRLHISSAYLKERVGRYKKVSFLTIAANLLGGRRLPLPQK